MFLFEYISSSLYFDKFVECIYICLCTLYSEIESILMTRRNFENVAKSQIIDNLYMPIYFEIERINYSISRHMYTILIIHAIFIYTHISEIGQYL